MARPSCNTYHLEFGLVTIPFPIPADQYDTIQILGDLAEQCQKEKGVGMQMA